MKKLYLEKTPNDLRTWVYPNYNRVVAIETEDTIELVEDANGDIFIEQIPSFVRVSSDKSPMKNSLGIKRYATVV